LIVEVYAHYSFLPAAAYQIVLWGPTLAPVCIFIFEVISVFFCPGSF